MRTLFSRYINAVMQEASYEELDNGTYSGIVPRFEARHYGTSFEACKANIRLILEGEISNRIISGKSLPVINGCDPKYIEIINSQELVYYLDLIGSLPLTPEWYVPETQVEKDEINKQRANWKDHEAWLRHFLLGESEPNYNQSSPLLGNSVAARLSAEFYKVVYEARCRSSILYQLGTTPKIWFFCEASDACREYNNSGLKTLVEEGKAQPKIIGKREQLRENSKAIKQLDLYREGLEGISESTTQISTEMLMTEGRSFILKQAAELAKDDPDFRIVFNRYLALAKKANSFWNNSTAYQTTAILHDGSRFIGGKTKNKGFSKTKNKGFSKTKD